MVSSRNMILAFIAVSMIATTASASIYKDSVTNWIDGNTTGIDYAFNLIWAFLAPLVAGPVRVFVKFLWDNYTLSFDIPIDGNTTTVTVDFGSTLPSIGIGSYEMLYIVLMELMVKIVKQNIPLMTTPTYTTLETDLLNTLNLGDLIA